jgi:hypothetical protein
MGIVHVQNYGFAIPWNPLPMHQKLEFLLKVPLQDGEGLYRCGPLAGLQHLAKPPVRDVDILDPASLIGDQLIDGSSRARDETLNVGFNQIVYIGTKQ